MTPEVISDTLNDCGLGPVTAQEINSYFESKPDEFEIASKSGAYKLSIDEAVSMMNAIQRDEKEITVPAKIFAPILLAFVVALTGAAYTIGRIHEIGIRETTP